MELRMTRIMYILIVLIQTLVGSNLIEAQEHNLSSNLNQVNEIENELIPDRSCNFLLDSSYAHATTPQIIEKYGYKSETHRVITEDGYILQIHRIPAPEKPPILLLHGVCSSSRDFVINCERRALAFKLADQGYDVWMGNVRGNLYSSHMNLSLGDAKYWDFSQDEMANIDAPAFVDYILNKTAMDKLSFVGMSMGNAVAMMMLSSKPEYNAKINIWFAMGATLDLKRTKSPPLRFISRFRKSLQKAMTRRNHGEFFPESLFRLWNTNVPIFCSTSKQSRNSDGICSNLWFLFDGYDPRQIPSEVWSVLVGEFPGRNSVKSMTHWFQWIHSGILSMFDYGMWENIIRYSSLRPKPYPLEKITTPVVLFGAENDWIATQGTTDDVKQITRTMGVKTDMTIIPVKSTKWNHVDFIHGKDADVLVYHHILERLNEIYKK